jgi:hypothetical protein
MDNMKIEKVNIAPTVCFYAFLVVISEVTLGNPEFPITVWRFVTIPTWQWSVPVHAIGFILLFFFNWLFYDKSIRIPIIASILYFLICETANWYIFHFFVYEPYPAGEALPIGAAGSFWFIILLYTALCTATSLLLRRRTNGG